MTIDEYFTSNKRLNHTKLANIANYIIVVDPLSRIQTY